jgi:hypothetical protein
MSTGLDLAFLEVQVLRRGADEIEVRDPENFQVAICPDRDGPFEPGDRFGGHRGQSMDTGDGEQVDGIFARFQSLGFLYGAVDLATLGESEEPPASSIGGGHS